MHMGVYELRTTSAKFDLNAVKVKFSTNNTECIRTSLIICII